MRIILASLFLLVGSTFCQSLSARNWLDYRGAKSGHSHFEDRVWMSLDFSNFSAGLLFWAQEPPRYIATATDDSTKAQLAQYWFGFYSPQLELTAGSFTQTLGQGLIIDLYERPDIQIDHHCVGASFTMRLPYTELIGFNGIARWDNNAIVRGGAATLSPWRTRIGAEYAKIIPDEPNYPTEMWGTYIALDLDFLSLWGEYAHKTPIGGLEKKGQAMYFSATAMYDRFTLTAEYADYDQFAIRTPLIQYNNPPILIREPYYTLPSRHLPLLIANDELGYTAALSGVVQNISFEAFYAHTQNHEGKVPFDQIWAEIEFRNDDETFEAKAATEYKDDKGEQFITPIVDILWEPDWTLFAFNGIAEFQKADDYNSVYGSFSVTYTPYATVGVEGGNIEDEGFIRGFADLNVLERTKVRLGYGKRPGGFTCSGGVCRYEEPFEGAELQIIITY